MDYGKTTGEILTASSILEIDEAKLREEADDKIIDMYRELWKMEEIFKVTKSELEARPVYV